MKLEILDKVLFRIPQFSMQTTLQEAWSDLKRSIRDASEYFYSVIKDLEYEDIDKQPLTVRFTIEKYFNRAKYRATPYGTFAGIGICQITPTSSGPLIIDENRQEHQFVDWKHASAMQQHWKGLPIDQLQLQTNSSYYRYLDSFRYLYKNEERFEISEIPYYTEIETILQRCSSTITYTSLISEIDTIGLAPDSLHEIVSELIESQLLFTNCHPNIIGEDYFTRVGSILPNPPQEKYTLCAHKLISGSLSKADFESIKEAVHFLHQCQDAANNNADLENFKEEFSRKYDMQAVPIMEVLDPVLGIGYGQMESMADTSPIVNKIAALKANRPNTQQQNVLKQFVLQNQTDTRLEVIDLADIEFKPSGNLLPLPNTLSALLSKADNHLIIEHLGGATATSLLGRFSLTGGEIHKFTKAIADIEQTSNPDVLFFDLAYMGEPTVDNVNRRLQIYEHELAICCWSENRDKINLDDILIQVRGSEVILYSQRLNKRLIPRLSTAYNYSRSDLSLFRLLCDIQTQNITTTLLPDLQSIVPDADHYPRLVFNNVILAKQSWRIKYNPEFEIGNSFRDYLGNKELSKYIKVGYADQTIRLNTANEIDIALLLSILKSRKELLITEVLPEHASAIKDAKDNGYASEFVLSLYHREQIYRGVDINVSKKPTIQRNFPPGSEWIYINIYCNNAVSNEILTNQISPTIDRLAGYLSACFFIRYNEGGDQIRLRLKPKGTNSYSKVFSKITAVINDLINCGIVQDSQLHTYKREIERYGHAGIDNIEQHFTVDSQYALNFLAKNCREQQLYLIISQTITKVAKHLFSEQQFESIIKQTLASFQKEHATDTSVYRQLNKTYRNESLNIDSLDLDLIVSFVRTVNNGDEKLRVSLFTDLFHMHINRLFPQYQRVHEYIIYEYLLLTCKQSQRQVMVSSV